jgi:hypothetical protein
MQLNNGYFYFHNKLNIYFITAYHTNTMNMNSGSKNIKYVQEWDSVRAQH